MHTTCFESLTHKNTIYEQIDSGITTNKQQRSKKITLNNKSSSSWILLQAQRSKKMHLI